LFRYSRDGENQWMGLGALADKPLTEARDEAVMLRVLVKRGSDPMAEKREGAEVKSKPKADKSKVPTFAECADRYIEAHRAGWKNDKHIAQWESTLRMYAGPVIGKKPVDQITVEDVLEVLKPIWTEKPETASRLRGRIEKVLGWATAMKFRSGDNPADWNGALGHLLPAISKVQKIQHHKAAPYREVPALMAELRKNHSISAKALMFTILTGARTGETIGAVPAEIDRRQKLWVLPRERMKAAREHRVPLSGAALAILDALPADSQYLFPGARGGALSNMAMLMLLRGIRDDGVTVHGFRSAFSTWAREQTDYPREIVEACLAHASGDAVEMAYLRTDFIDKRRALMGDWARFCGTGR
ncbi:MAG: tyrosine-type recombinase/integrase, partial [Devosia sp.]